MVRKYVIRTSTQSFKVELAERSWNVRSFTANEINENANEIPLRLHNRSHCLSFSRSENTITER